MMLIVEIVEYKVRRTPMNLYSLWPLRNFNVVYKQMTNKKIENFARF